MVVCFVALDIQHAMGVRHIVTCELSGCTAFVHILINGTFFGWGEGEITKHKICVLICTTAFFSEHFLVIRTIQRDITTNVLRSPCKVPVIFARF